MPDLTRDTLKDLLLNTGNPATLTGLRAAATLEKRPTSWDLAVKDPGVVQWVAGLDQSEPTADDPRAVTLSKLVEEGTPGAPDGVRPLLRGPLPDAPTIAAALVTLATAAGHAGTGWLTGKRPDKPTTGVAVKTARVVAIDLLGSAVLGHTARPGDCEDAGAVVVPVGGGFYHVKAEHGPAVPFVPADCIGASAVLGYNGFRPWSAGPMDKRGNRKRIADKPRTFIVRRPATEKTPARAVAVKGYPLADVTLALVSVRPGKDARKRAIQGAVDWVRDHGVKEAAAMWRDALATAAGDAAAADPTVRAMIVHARQEVENDRQEKGRQEKRTASGYDRKVKRIKETADKMGRPAAAPAVTPGTVTKRRPGKKAQKGAQGAA